MLVYFGYYQLNVVVYNRDELDLISLYLNYFYEAIKTSHMTVILIQVNE